MSRTKPNPEMPETKRVEIFDKTNFVVDRLHFKGHVKGGDCEKFCNPDLYKELIGANTQVCEQLNFFLGPFKHITKHMGQFRFNFYLYIILNTLNSIKLDGFINIIDSQQLSKFNSIKRKTCEDV